MLVIKNRCAGNINTVNLESDLLKQTRIRRKAQNILRINLESGAAFKGYDVGNCI